MQTVCGLIKAELGLKFGHTSQWDLVIRYQLLSSPHYLAVLLLVNVIENNEET